MCKIKLQQTYFIECLCIYARKKLQENGRGILLIIFCFRMRDVMSDVRDHTIRWCTWLAATILSYKYTLC